MKVEDSQKLGKHVNKKGISWPMTAVFVIGHCAGAGMLAMPISFASMGLYVGIVITFLCASFSLYTGMQLGWMWRIMQDLWPEYKKPCQNPYGEIAYRAIGPKSRTATAFIMCFTELGYVVILLLLAAKNLSVLFHFFFHLNINQCYIIIIVALVIWPLTMLRSPVNFWQIALVSAASSWIAVILIVIGVWYDSGTCSQDVPHDPINIFNSFMSYGSIVFAYAAHPSFPTFQNDMKKPADFTYSLILTWVVITIYYLVLSCFGYFVYGSTVNDAIISSIQHASIQQMINLMFAIHVISTIILAASPPFQQFEQIFNVPFKFGWKRFVVRSVIFGTAAFTALTFPHFGPMVDLFGASMNTLSAIILPSVFYLSMRSQHILKTSEENPVKSQKNDEETRPTLKEIFKTTPKPILVLNIATISFGAIAGIVATVSAFYTFFHSTLAPPCYVQYFRQGLPFSSSGTGAVNCCGSYRNITVSGNDPNDFCSFSN